MKLYVFTLRQAWEEDYTERPARRSNNSFLLLHIAVGEETFFLYRDRASAGVVSDRNQLKYEGKQYSVTALAQKLLSKDMGRRRMRRSTAGGFFTKDGIFLRDLRSRIENAETED